MHISPPMGTTHVHITHTCMSASSLSGSNTIDRHKRSTLHAQRHRAEATTHHGCHGPFPHLASWRPRQSLSWLITILARHYISLGTQGLAFCPTIALPTTMPMAKAIIEAPWHMHTYHP